MRIYFLVLCLAAVGGPVAVAQTSEPAGPAPEVSNLTTPHFQEVLRLIRGNLEGVTEDELNRAMVEGLLGHFGPRVLLRAGAMPGATTPEPEPLLGRATLYEGSFGYLHLRRVAEGLPPLVAAALRDLPGTNRLEGLVLDLRFAEGRDYRAAAAVAGQFIPEGKVLLRWEDETLTSPGPGNPALPVVVLVNRQTAGAAEALAGALRELGPVVVIGSRTAGRAFAMRSFQLETGQELQIASAPVRVGQDRSLAEGVTPDLEIPFQPDLERVWLEDPHRLPEGDKAPVPAARPRFDEAELMRQHNGDAEPGPMVSVPTALGEAASPRLHDPALVRAVAVLKGLSRVRGGIHR